MHQENRSPEANATGQPDPAEVRRMLQVIGIGLLVALVASFAIVFGMRHPHTLTLEEHGILNAYESVRVALARDDLPAARESAAKMAEQFADRALTAEPARKISDAGALGDARAAFKDLSSDAVSLARGQSGYFIAHCPIENCPEPCRGCPMDRFGPWVQVSTKIENPYMGRAHSRCGIIGP